MLPSFFNCLWRLRLFCFVVRCVSPGTNLTLPFNPLHVTGFVLPFAVVSLFQSHENSHHSRFRVGALTPLFKLGTSLVKSRSLDVRIEGCAPYSATLLMGGNCKDRRLSATRAMSPPPLHSFVTLSMDSNSSGMSAYSRVELTPVRTSFTSISYLLLADSATKSRQYHKGRPYGKANRQNTCPEGDSGLMIVC
jgi:hypothetical protein